MQQNDGTSSQSELENSRMNERHPNLSEDRIRLFIVYF